MSHSIKNVAGYNPYSKNAAKHKIHLPYLRKHKRPLNKISKENASKRRNERVASNASFEINRNKM